MSIDDALRLGHETVWIEHGKLHRMDRTHVEIPVLDVIEVLQRARSRTLFTNDDDDWTPPMEAAQDLDLIRSTLVCGTRQELTLTPSGLQTLQEAEGIIPIEGD